MSGPNHSWHNRTASNTAMATQGNQRKACDDEEVLLIVRRTLCSIHANHCIRPLPFAQEEIFAEEQVVRRDGAGDFDDADVVEVDAAAFEVFLRLAARRAKAGVDEEVEE